LYSFLISPLLDSANCFSCSALNACSEKLEIIIPYYYENEEGIIFRKLFLPHFFEKKYKILIFPAPAPEKDAGAFLIV
jgi:hypothetical protein